MKIEIEWTRVKDSADFPTDGRYLVTVENRDGQRKVTLLNARQLWNGHKVVAFAPLPAPFSK